MGTFLFIVFLLITLLVIIIIGSIQNLSVYCVTKQKHEFVYMVLPALLSLIVFLFITIATYFTLNLFNIDTLNLIFSMIMKFEYSFNNYIIMIISYIVSILLFVVIQAFCLKLSNIQYDKIYNYIKRKIKLIKKEKNTNPKDNENEIKINELEENNENISNLPATVKEVKQIPFFYTFSASLFTFAICFFSSLLLFYIGTLIGKSYII